MCGSFKAIKSREIMVKKNAKSYCIIIEDVGCYYIPRFDDDVCHPVPDEYTCMAQTLNYLINTDSRRREAIIHAIKVEMKEFNGK
jgi:hypothetical protein